MAAEQKDNQITYIEFPALDIKATKKFYEAVFGWEFTDFGPDYTSFTDGRTTGGFTRVHQLPGTAPLVVLWSSNLHKARKVILAHGGRIVKEPFSYPGGERFHFLDPNGNELAACTEE